MKTMNIFWCITALLIGSQIFGVVPRWSHVLHVETPQVGKPSGTGGRSVWLPTCTTIDMPIYYIEKKCLSMSVSYSNLNSIWWERFYYNLLCFRVFFLFFCIWRLLHSEKSDFQQFCVLFTILKTVDLRLIHNTVHLVI